MPKITISVPQDLHDRMSSLPEVDWNGAACSSFRKKLEEAERAQKKMPLRQERT